MLTQRPVDLTQDREFLLDLACMASYQGLPTSYRGESYRVYRQAYLSSPQAKSFIDRMAASLKDPQTVAEVWLEDGQPAGVVWLTFEDSLFHQPIAMLRALSVSPGHQRRGIGTMMLQSVEAMAKAGAAGILRVDTSVENESAESLYQKAGFSVASLLYEKVLEGPGA